LVRKGGIEFFGKRRDELRKMEEKACEKEGFKGGKSELWLISEVWFVLLYNRVPGGATLMQL